MAECIKFGFLLVLQPTAPHRRLRPARELEHTISRRLVRTASLLALDNGAGLKIDLTGLKELAVSLSLSAKISLSCLLSPSGRSTGEQSKLFTGTWRERKREAARQAADKGSRLDLQSSSTSALQNKRTQKNDRNGCKARNYVDHLTMPAERPYVCTPASRPEKFPFSMMLWLRRRSIWEKREKNYFSFLVTLWLLSVCVCWQAL